MVIIRPKIKRKFLNNIVPSVTVALMGLGRIGGRMVGIKIRGVKMSRVEIGRVYTLIDSSPPAFAKIIKITFVKEYNFQDDAVIREVAWGDWYQWEDKETRWSRDTGFDVRRLTEASFS
jgi:hypothetical protein